MKRQERQSRKRLVYGIAIACLCTGYLSVQTAAAEIGITKKVSVDSQGIEANEPSYSPSLSAEGRFVAFASAASNLVPNDTNNADDVFVHDRATGNTTRVSVDSQGMQANERSSDPALSADGRFVAFASTASNVVPNDTNDAIDIFVHDRSTGHTTRVSVDSQETQANEMSGEPTLSADGRFVAFVSSASNLVPNDTNNASDVFVHDRATGKTTRVNVDSQGMQANNDSYSWEPTLSADGYLVAFTSAASNLVPNDTNNAEDVFVHDRATGKTTRVSVDSQGMQANKPSYSPSLSAEGRFVAFASAASNLVSNDTNNAEDIFVHDRATGETTRVNVDSQGMQADAISLAPTLSADGRFVAFESWTSHLVPNDTNNASDVFVHDRSTGHTTRVSVDSQGMEANDFSWGPTLSADGYTFAFRSWASNLVPNDSHNSEDSLSDDIFVHSRVISLTALHSGKCLDVQKFSLDNGARVQQRDCQGQDNQRWALEPAGTAEAPSYFLRAVHSGKCLDVQKFSLDNGARVQQWNCQGQDNQRWVLDDPLSF